MDDTKNDEEVTGWRWWAFGILIVVIMVCVGLVISNLVFTEDSTPEKKVVENSITLVADDTDPPTSARAAAGFKGVSKVRGNLTKKFRRGKLGRLAQNHGAFNKAQRIAIIDKAMKVQKRKFKKGKAKGIPWRSRKQMRRAFFLNDRCAYSTYKYGHTLRTSCALTRSGRLRGSGLGHEDFRVVLCATGIAAVGAGLKEIVKTGLKRWTIVGIGTASVECFDDWYRIKRRKLHNLKHGHCTSSRQTSGRCVWP